MKQSKKPKAATRSLYRPATASLIIRIGLAGVFAYAAIDAFREPDAWVSFVPAFGSHFIAAKTALDVVSVAQLGLAVWLLAGRYVRYAALVACVLLAGIVVFNLPAILVTFRDFGLVAAAVALLFLDES